MRVEAKCLAIGDVVRWKRGDLVFASVVLTVLPDSDGLTRWILFLSIEGRMAWGTYLAGEKFECV